MKNPNLKTIAGRCLSLILKEFPGDRNPILSFANAEKLSISDKKSLQAALTEGRANELNAKWIKLIYNRYKDETSLIWLMYGKHDREVDRYVKKVKKLEEKNNTLIKETQSFYEIKKIIDKLDKKD